MTEAGERSSSNALSACQLIPICAAPAALFGKTIMLELTAHEQQFHTVPADRWQELFSKFKMGRESALAHVLQVSSASLLSPSSATAAQHCQACCKSCSIMPVQHQQQLLAGTFRCAIRLHCMLPFACAAWPVLTGGWRHHNAGAGRAAAGQGGAWT